MNSQSPVTCREVRQALPAYIHHELPASQRSRIARHLDTCASCYARYARDRDVMHSMETTLPTIGRGAEAGRFELMWREIASQIALRRRQINMRSLMTSGVALLAVVMMALAWTPTTSVAGVPTQPTAAENDARTTPIASSVAAAFLSDNAASATATPPLQGNYPPAPDATDEPWTGLRDFGQQ